MSAHTSGAASLLAHLNLMLMVVAGACLWQGAAILRNLPKPDDLAQLERLQKGASGVVEQLWTGAGAALVALGCVHYLLAHLAVGAAVSPCAGLFIFYTVLMVALCCGEAGCVGWSVTAMHAAPAPPDVVLRLVPPELALIFGLFFPGNQERIKEVKDAVPELVYLAYGGALSLLLLQLASCVTALCAAWGCRSRGSVRDYRDDRASAPPRYP